MLLNRQEMKQIKSEILWSLFFQDRNGYSILTKDNNFTLIHLHEICVQSFLSLFIFIGLPTQNENL